MGRRRRRGRQAGAPAGPESPAAPRTQARRRAPERGAVSETRGGAGGCGAGAFLPAPGMAAQMQS